MNFDLIHLKILLPFEVFLENKNVSRINVETINGFYGLLPNRLDCTASLKPGILTYETANEEKLYVALDEGILVKTGTSITISVRNAVGGVDLGELHQTLKNQFLILDEKEKNTRTTIAKLESGLIRQFDKLQKQ
jgi:F-type H+-transporting ATPase subunit epsilon